MKKQYRRDLLSLLSADTAVRIRTEFNRKVNSPDIACYWLVWEGTVSFVARYVAVHVRARNG